jgi:uncharacterized protein (TIGR04255 family)
MRGGAVPFTGLEHHERLRFRRNPLKTVVLQIRFPHLYGLESPTGVAPFQREITELYPVALPREELVSVSIGGQRPPAADTGARYRFRDPNGEWIVALAPDYLSLETTAYERFEDFGERASHLLGIANRLLHPTHCERIGLRYINELPADGKQDWRAFIVPELRGIAGQEVLTPYLGQALEQLTLNLPSYQMTIHHGLVRSVEGEKRYLIDIDAYSTGLREFDEASIMAIVAELKDASWRFFRGSITDELIAHLKGSTLESK